MNKRNHSISVRLLKIIFYLIEPPPDVTDVQKKSQSRLLSALLLIIILLGSGSAIIQWLLVPGFLSTFISIEGAVIILFMAYLLVHRGQFITAAIIASITPSLACYASLLTNTNDPSAFVFMLISVLLGSILLNQRLTIGIASLNLLALLLLPILQPAWTYSMMGGIVSYHIIIPLLILLSMWHRDWLERDRREELRRRSERFSVLFNSTSDIQMVLSIGDDRNFYIEAVNQSYLNGIRRFKPDLTERDVIGRNRAEFQREVAHVSPQELNARDRLFWQAIDGRTPVRIEDVISSPQGNIYLDVLIVPIVEPDGTCKHVFWSARDVTSRKMAELALQESELKFRSIFDNSVDAIGVSRAGVHVMANPAYVNIFGYESADQLVGKSILDLIAPSHRVQILDFVRRRAAGEEIPSHYETCGLRRDGTEFDMEVHVSTYELGGERYTVPILRDITERKKSEDQIQYQANLLKNVSDAIIASDMDFKIVSWNQAAEALYGWQAGEVIGRPVSDVLQTEYLSEPADHVRQRFLEQGFWKGEVIQKHKDRFGLYILSSVSSIIDENGQPAGAVAVNHDITERRRMEEALRESEERYRIITELMSDYIFKLEIDPNGNVTIGYLSENYNEITGRTLDQIKTTETWSSILHPGDLGMVMNLLHTIIATGQPGDLECRSYVKEGRQRWVHVVARPVADQEGGAVTKIVGSVKDITERKQIQRELEENRHRLAFLLEKSPSVIYSAKASGDFEKTFISANVTNQLGYQPEDFINDPGFWMDHIHPDDAPRVFSELEKFFEHGVHTHEYRFRHKNGQYLWMRDELTLIRDDAGKPSEMIGSWIDITESKRAEDALRLSEQRYRILAQNLPDSALLLYNQDLRFIIADGPEIEGTGFSREMLEGKTLHEALPAEFAKLVEPNMRSALAGETFYAELPYEDRFYRYSYVPLRDSSGKVAMAMILATNITQLKKTEDALKDSQRRLSTALHATKVGVWEWDINTNKTYWSDENYEVMGLEPDSIESRYENWAKCVHPDDLPEAEAKVTEAVNSKSDLNIEFRVVWPDGSIHWINDIGSMLMDEAGQPLGMYGIQMDVTERKRMEEMLFEEKERAQITLQSIGDAVITTDVQARVKYLNPVAETMTGWKLEEAIDQPLDHVFRIIDEGSRQPAVNPVGRCLHEGRIVGLANHSVLIRRDGREFAVDDSAAPIRNRQGEIIGVVLVFHDVTEERRLSQQVAHDAMHDSLTGLVNRREFEKRLERALVNTKERAISHILCYLDLDQFKIVNDTAGHMAGDELLKQVSGLLAGLFRQRDTLARLGGDEFGLLLENCQLDRALVISNEIIAKIRDFPFVWATQSFQVGVSIGLVPITSETESVAQLLSQADIACYSAKDLGRGRIHIYQIEDSETTQRHSEILQASRMQDAIIHNQFRLYCQPIMKVKGQKMKMRQYELLLRMIDSKEQLVLPSAFIPSAERYGLMPAIDRWVIRQTLLTMSNYEMRGMQITINLSGNSLDDETLLGYVLAQLHEYSISPNQICFEITETAAIHHLSKAQHFIQAFRERGGRIALDDFGSGFSSFRYLKTLAVDYIKIDGGFVSDMLSNPSDLMMVQAITQIAHTLGIEVIAEHAADLKIINRLRKMGVDHAQGFGIGRPIPVEEAWDARKK